MLAPFMFPICAVCDKPVEELERYVTNFGRTFIWIARCHGSEEVARLEEYQIVEATEIRFEKAFVKEKLKQEWLKCIPQ